MDEVAEGLAQVGVVREHQAHLAERQVASKDGIVADVPPEGIHGIPKGLGQPKQNTKIQPSIDR